jgi:pimeloyl-ACP methyl ester carboxylesterase
VKGGIPRERRKGSSLRSWIRRIWASLGLLATAALAWTFQAHGLPPGVLESDAEVRVERTGAGLEFRPAAESGSAGLVFFPGGMVQLKAYAPLARAIAREGFPVVLVRLPFLGRHAPGAGQQAEVIERVAGEIGRDTLRDWAIAGHSFGGSLAARFAHGHAGRTAALILIGTTHPRDLDLSGAGYPVARIYGTRDGVAPESRMRETARNLPPDALLVPIEGGNHAQFGYYGPQLGDSRATITREEQMRRTVAAITGILRSL